MNVPFPFRVAAGVLGVGIDRVRSLPEDLPAAAVSLAGHALRASMRVRQEVEHLAGRGEELLAPLIEQPEEHPAWARFDDEDDGAADAPSGGAAGTGAAGGAVGGVDAADGGVLPAAGPGVADTATASPGPPPAALDYGELGINDLRARLEALTPTDIAALLAYESAHQNRAVFVTVLRNRLTSAESAESAASARNKSARSRRR